MSFWYDVWCGDKAFKEAFLNLFGITFVKNASVSAHFELFGGSNQWNVSFVKAAHDLEVDVFALFFNFLYSEQNGNVKTGFGRFPLKKGCSLLAPSIRSLFIMVAFIFL